MDTYRLDNSPSKEERETVAVYDEMTDTWSIFSNVRKHITKLTKIFGEEGFEKAGVDENGRLMEVWVENATHSQVSFRNKSKPRELTDEQKKELAERLAKNRGK